MAFFKVGVRLPGVPGMLLVRDVHERSPLSFVADAICVRIGVGVSQFVHLGYERLVPGHSGLEVVSLHNSTRVGQAYNLVLRVSSVELSAVYCPMRLILWLLILRLRRAPAHSINLISTACLIIVQQTLLGKTPPYTFYVGKNM